MASLSSSSSPRGADATYQRLRAQYVKAAIDREHLRLVPHKAAPSASASASALLSAQPAGPTTAPLTGSSPAPSLSKTFVAATLPDYTALNADARYEPRAESAQARALAEQAQQLSDAKQLYVNYFQPYTATQGSQTGGMSAATEAALREWAIKLGLVPATWRTGGPDAESKEADAFVATLQAMREYVRRTNHMPLKLLVFDVTGLHASTIPAGGSAGGGGDVSWIARRGTGPRASTRPLHFGLQIGPFAVDWNPNGLVRPYALASSTPLLQRTVAAIDLDPAFKPSADAFRALCELMAGFNTRTKYVRGLGVADQTAHALVALSPTAAAASAALPQSTPLSPTGKGIVPAEANAFDFVVCALKELDVTSVPWLASGVISRWLNDMQHATDAYDDDGAADAAAAAASAAAASAALTAGAVAPPPPPMPCCIAYPTATAGAGAAAAATPGASSYRVFHTHAELDDFVYHALRTRRVEPKMQEYYLLKALDRAFWIRAGLQPRDCAYIDDPRASPDGRCATAPGVCKCCPFNTVNLLLATTDQSEPGWSYLRPTQQQIDRAKAQEQLHQQAQSRAAASDSKLGPGAATTAASVAAATALLTHPPTRNAEFPAAVVPDALAREWHSAQVTDASVRAQVVGEYIQEHVLDDATLRDGIRAGPRPYSASGYVSAVPSPAASHRVPTDPQQQQQPQPLHPMASGAAPQAQVPPSRPVLDGLASQPYECKTCSLRHPRVPSDGVCELCGGELAYAGRQTLAEVAGAAAGGAARFAHQTTVDVLSAALNSPDTCTLPRGKLVLAFGGSAKLLVDILERCVPHLARLNRQPLLPSSSSPMSFLRQPQHEPQPQSTGPVPISVQVRTPAEAAAALDDGRLAWCTLQLPAASDIATATKTNALCNEYRRMLRARQAGGGVLVLHVVVTLPRAAAMAAAMMDQPAADTGVLVPASAFTTISWERLADHLGADVLNSVCPPAFLSMAQTAAVYTGLCEARPETDDTAEQLPSDRFAAALDANALVQRARMWPQQPNNSKNTSNNNPAAAAAAAAAAGAGAGAGRASAAAEAMTDDSKSGGIVVDPATTAAAAAAASPYSPSAAGSAAGGSSFLWGEQQQHEHDQYLEQQRQQRRGLDPYSRHPYDSKSSHRHDEHHRTAYERAAAMSAPHWHPQYGGGAASAAGAGAGYNHPTSTKPTPTPTPTQLTAAQQAAQQAAHADARAKHAAALHAQRTAYYLTGRGQAHYLCVVGAWGNAFSATPQLTGLETDAQRVRALCAARGIEPAPVSLSSRPTYEEAIVAMNYLFALPGDIVLYHTGHGDSNGDWLMYDGLPTSPRITRAAVMARWQTVRKLCRVANRLTIVSDSCHSGAWITHGADGGAAFWADLTRRQVPLTMWMSSHAGVRSYEFDHRTSAGAGQSHGLGGYFTLSWCQAHGLGWDLPVPPAPWQRPQLRTSWPLPAGHVPRIADVLLTLNPMPVDARFTTGQWTTTTTPTTVSAAAAASPPTATAMVTDTTNDSKDKTGSSTHVPHDDAGTHAPLTPTQALVLRVHAAAFAAAHAAPAAAGTAAATAAAGAAAPATPATTYTTTAGALEGAFVTQHQQALRAWLAPLSPSSPAPPPSSSSPTLGGGTANGSFESVTDLDWRLDDAPAATAAAAAAGPGAGAGVAAAAAAAATPMVGAAPAAGAGAGAGAAAAFSLPFGSPPVESLAIHPVALATHTRAVVYSDAFHDQLVLAARASVRAQQLTAAAAAAAAAVLPTPAAAAGGAAAPGPAVAAVAATGGGAAAAAGPAVAVGMQAVVTTDDPVGRAVAAVQRAREMKAAAAASQHQLPPFAAGPAALGAGAGGGGGWPVWQPQPMPVDARGPAARAPAAGAGAAGAAAAAAAAAGAAMADDDVYGEDPAHAAAPNPWSSPNAGGGAGGAHGR